MSIIGKVESLWRYPVKSMRGQELDTAYVGFAGVYGDRLYAFRSSVAPEGFPYLTGREQERMLLYQPRFRYADRAAKPVNLAAAENIAPGITPLYADGADLAVDVETPSGEVVAIDHPVLADMRFRANIYLHLDDAGGFAENVYVGRKLQVGQKVMLSVLERDPRRSATMSKETFCPSLRAPMRA